MSACALSRGLQASAALFGLNRMHLSLSAIRVRDYSGCWTRSRAAIFFVHSRRCSMKRCATGFNARRFSVMRAIGHCRGPNAIGSILNDRTVSGWITERAKAEI